MTAELKALQLRVERVSRLYETQFAIEPGEDWIMFKLQEELGELTQAYLAGTGRSRRRLHGDEAREALARELADVLGFTLALAERMGIDAGSALGAKWLRYETGD